MDSGVLSCLKIFSLSEGKRNEKFFVGKCLDICWMRDQVETLVEPNA